MQPGKPDTTIRKHWWIATRTNNGATPGEKCGWCGVVRLFGGTGALERDREPCPSMNDKPAAPGTTDFQCLECDGRGWLGACTGGQFAYIGRLALNGRLSKRTCWACDGTGRIERWGPATALEMNP